MRYSVDPSHERLEHDDLRRLFARWLAADAARDVDHPDQVIWADLSDEVLLHLDHLDVATRDGMLAVSVPLEAVETGCHPILVVLALAGAPDGAGLFATTDELARGDRALAARWGGLVQDAVWGALLDAADEYARRRGLVPWGITADSDGVVLHAGPEFAEGASRCRC